MSNACGCGPMSLMLPAVMPMTNLLRIAVSVPHCLGHLLRVAIGMSQLPSVASASVDERQTRVRLHRLRCIARNVADRIDLHQKTLRQSRGRRACHRVRAKRGPMINSASVSKDGGTRLAAILRDAR